ncbi:TP53-binding protein 1 [Pseudolycoriella hygida]|uniref:TP53-binding protein 1 n=1 Tax=Pseudolycoriella hygida TaxID=35572 RepID=A0A9Q0RX12_9DIPT|nr:TP53-binding protein 1 [Pseudolycoriella hygida]
MEDQASSLQLDLIDNGLSHNGNNLEGMEISESFQSQKVVDHSNDVDGSNGINLLDTASSTTSETVNDQTSADVKKVQNASNGVEEKIASESTENHQDDDLIRELEQFEGSKKDDEVKTSVAEATEENGSNLQDTTDLLKDLESDSPCPGPSDIEMEKIDSAIGDELMEVDEAKKADDVHVDSTTESSNKRKPSPDSFVESSPKRANVEVKSETISAPDVLNNDTQKSTSEIDSDTESKLLQENSDGEASNSDVVEASITSTSTATKTPNEVTTDAKPADNITTPNEDPVVSSSGNLETTPTNVDATKDDKQTDVLKDDDANVNESIEPKGDDEVSSNKNDTTEVMEQDLDETVEAECKIEKDEKVTSNETESPAEIQDKSEEVDSKTNEIAVSEAEPVESSEGKPTSMEIDAEPEPQTEEAKEATEKFNGLPITTAESNVDSKNSSGIAADIAEETDSGKVEAAEPVQAEKIFEIRLFYENKDFKSMSIESSEEKKTTEETVGETSSEPIKHTATNVVELCDFMLQHFGELKKSLNVGEDSSPKVASNRGKGSAKKSATTPSSVTQVTPKSGKRNSTSKTDEAESKAKKAKSSEKPNDDEEEVKGDCCLARWTDRKYYAGRVTEEKPGNKFSVRFEDGATKVLAAEVIVFGTGNELPLLDHSVHVLVSDDTYEPGIVTKIETDGDVVKYTVVAESKTVTCSASDIYLMDDQAKAIHNSIKSKEVQAKTPETPSAKRTGRLPAKLEETITTAGGGRSSRGKKGQSVTSPEPGFSGDIDAKKSGRRSKRSVAPQTRISESSDFSESHGDLSSSGFDSALEAISGVQPELQNTQEIVIEEYLGGDSTQNLSVVLGPMPKKRTLFKGCHFLLTCTIPMKKARLSKAKDFRFCTTPFLKEHLCSQIEQGGGVVYSMFENIPKETYGKCILIAQFPCTTARYIQCLAANIMPVSHEWIIDCCTKNQLLSCDDYILPSGWSMVDELFIKWKVSRSKTSRKSSKPLRSKKIMIDSSQGDFGIFWKRVCTLNGAKVIQLERVKRTSSSTVIIDEEFDEEIKWMAEKYKMPLVSSVWIVQSLIVGYPFDSDASPKLKLPFDDEDF